MFVVRAQAITVLFSGRQTHAVRGIEKSFLDLKRWLISTVLDWGCCSLGVLNATAQNEEMGVREWEPIWNGV
jgi:hypothetical protein